jgi:AcrR family transcriptional regulator
MPSASPAIAPTPGSRRSRAEQKAASRRRILEAAREVFFSQGYADASLDAIADQAGVAKGTLYRHIESKAELYVLVLMEDGEEFEARMRDAISPHDSAADQLRAIGEFYQAHWIDHPQHFRIFWAVNNQAFIGEIPGRVTARVKNLWERPLRMLEAVVRKGVETGELRKCDPWVMANVIWRIGNGAVEALSTPEPHRVVDCPPMAIYRDSLELIVSGLARSEP